jgi:hypothetical protein
MYVMYYALILWCWQLVWILVKTNHPCLRVGRRIALNPHFIGLRQVFFPHDEAL